MRIYVIYCFAQISRAALVIVFSGIIIHRLFSSCWAREREHRSELPGNCTKQGVKLAAKEGSPVGAGKWGLSNCLVDVGMRNMRNDGGTVSCWPDFLNKTLFQALIYFKKIFWINFLSCKSSWQVFVNSIKYPRRYQLTIFLIFSLYIVLKAQDWQRAEKLLGKDAQRAVVPEEFFKFLNCLLITFCYSLARLGPLCLVAVQLQQVTPPEATVVIYQETSSVVLLWTPSLISISVKYSVVADHGAKKSDFICLCSLQQ